MDSPAPQGLDLHELLIGRIGHFVKSRPRDVQKAIGPSEVGDPCNRALIARLTNTPQKPEKPNWKAEVGTAIHADLEPMFNDPDFITEKDVMVGYIGGEPIVGRCDLFHIPSGTVVDWKSKGKTTMNKHKRFGPGAKYITQAQLYGLGYATLGYTVKRVMIEFLPRDGELLDGFSWSAPYEPLLGLLALLRADGLLRQAQTLGAKAAMEAYPPCDDEWCRTCHDPSKIRPGQPRVASADNPFALSF